MRMEDGYGEALLWKGQRDPNVHHSRIPTGAGLRLHRGLPGGDDQVHRTEFGENEVQSSDDADHDPEGTWRPGESFQDKHIMPFSREDLLDYFPSSEIVTGDLPWSLPMAGRRGRALQ